MAKKSLYHYISMAESNFRELKGDMVKAKKYFYVLRPVLACRWIMEKETPPPMLFEKLAEAELPEFLKDEVDRLLELKINSPEIKTIPRVELLNEFLAAEIKNIKCQISEMKDSKDAGWKTLDEFFLDVVSKK